MNLFPDPLFRKSIGLAWDFGQVLTEIDGYFVSLQRKLDDFGQDLTESLPITALFMINKNMNREQIIEVGSIN